MISSTRRSIPVMMAGALSLTGVAAFGQQSQPTQQELLDVVKSLQAKVAQLEARQEPPVSSTGHGAEKAVADRTIAQVLDDAEKRSQLLGEGGVTAGWLKGKPTIQSEDGKFSLSPIFLFQGRFIASYLDESPATGEDDFESGFEIRRLRIGASGQYDRFGFKFLWDTGVNTGGVSLRDAEISYKLSDTLMVFGGQFKDPVHHEEMMTPGKQLAVERSLTNELIGGGVTDRVQGVGITHESGPLMATLVLTDGANSDNSNFTSGVGAEWGGAARVEYVVYGDKKAYSDFTAMGNKNDLLVIGAGADITGLQGANQYTYTFDAQWENASGLAVYAAVLGQTIDGHGSNSNDSNFGAIGQVAYLLPDSKWEVFGRAGWIHYESDPDNDDIFEITGGVNYYFHGHNAKFTADVTILPNGSPAFVDIGVRDSGDEFQIMGRVQFQLAI